MRAVAIGAVLLNHFFQDILPGGFLGVDVFFVISGYVITTSLLSHDKQSAYTFLVGFWSRRVKRLLPALVFCVVVTSLVGLLFISPDVVVRGDSAKTGIAALFGMSNLFLFKNAMDYFGTLSEVNLFTQTWSLGVEEQFYAIYPLIFWVMLLSHRVHLGEKWLMAGILSLSVASLVGFGLCIEKYPMASYYLMPMRFWELGAGVMMRLLIGARPPSISNTAVSGLLLLLFAMFLVPPDYQLYSTVTAVVCTTLLIAAGRKDSWPHRILTHKAVLYVGLISYSLYLWHWSVLAISRWTIGVHWWSFPFQLLLIFALAVFSYHVIERPLRYSNILGRNIRTIAYGLTLAAVSSGLVWAAGISFKQQFFLGQQEQGFAYDRQWKGETCNIFRDRDFSLSPKVCGVEGGEPGRSRQTLYLLGDSHAEQFVDVLSYYATRRGMDFVSVWGNSCSFPPSAMYLGDTDCIELQTRVRKDLLARVSPGDVVVVGNALYPKFSGDWGDVPDFRWKGRHLSVAQARDLYMDRLERFAGELQRTGARLVVYLDSVQFRDLKVDGVDPVMCRQAWFRPFPLPACQRSKAGFLSLRAPIETPLRRLEARGLLQVWDGLDSRMCEGDSCSAGLMADSNHFRRDYRWYVGEQFMTGRFLLQGD